MASAIFKEIIFYSTVNLLIYQARSKFSSYIFFFPFYLFIALKLPAVDRPSRKSEPGKAISHPISGRFCLIRLGPVKVSPVTISDFLYRLELVRAVATRGTETSMNKIYSPGPASKEIKENIKEILIYLIST